MSLAENTKSVTLTEERHAGDLSRVWELIDGVGAVKDISVLPSQPCPEEESHQCKEKYPVSCSLLCLGSVRGHSGELEAGVLLQNWGSSLPHADLWSLSHRSCCKPPALWIMYCLLMYCLWLLLKGIGTAITNVLGLISLQRADFPHPVFWGFGQCCFTYLFISKWILSKL